MPIINKSIGTCTLLKGKIWFRFVSKLDFLPIFHTSFSGFYGCFMAASFEGSLKQTELSYLFIFFN